MAARLRHPLVILAVLSLVSIAVRLAWLDAPCRTPCRGASARVLVFDEDYYVNAARTIAGVTIPSGQRYAGAPSGDDPNSEHPQLAKLIIAGAIEVFGDGPFAWRIGSVLFGTLALLGLFVLVRAAGGSRWLALGAAALMCADNLLLVHGRIGTLDIYVVTAMIWGAALYLRGSPVAAGVVIGVGVCMKEVAPYALVALAAFELLSGSRGRIRSQQWWRPLLLCAASAAVVSLALLAVLDRVAPPYNPLTGHLVGGGVFGHIGHMISYAAGQASPDGPRGIASYPWEWLADYKPIVYLNIDLAHPAPGLYGVHPAVHFLGMMSPPIMLAAVPALLLAGFGALGGSSLARGTFARLPGAVRRATPVPSRPAMFGLAWFLGTWLPFEVLSAIWSRTSYLYYMVVVMPGLYILAAELAGRVVRGRLAIGACAVAVIVAAVLMYPLTPLPS
jgi:4-amino-4-deoxy-L-arabinose transferase-like glycosyltransferase